MYNLDILYEDNHIIVCYKDSGILSQADNTDSIDMLTIIKDYIKNKYNKPGNVFLGLVHRLDRNTEGIMVFAKTSKAAKRLFESINNDEFTKKYYALVENKPIKKESTLEDYILKDEKNKKAYINKNGKLAKLHYKLHDEVTINNKQLYLLDITLYTGRFHQIRCQLSNIGIPLYLDKKYNPKVSKSNYFLCAYYLKFKHPTLDKYLEFTINPYEKLQNHYK